MIKTWSLLHSFTRAEHLRFRRFLQSPYFNRHKEVQLLSDFLLEKRHNTAAPSIEKAFAHIFPKQELHLPKIRHILSYLNSSIDQFLIQEEIKENDNYQHCMLLRALRKRNLPHAFDQEDKKLSKKLNSSGQRGLSYHFTRYLSNEESYQKQVLVSKDVEQVLQASSDSLDLWYMINKLKHACNAYAHQLILKADYQFYMLDEVLIEVERRSHTSNPAIAVYFHCFMAMRDASEMHFDLLYDALQVNEQHFSLEEMKGIYLLAINFCIRQLNTGKKAYLKKVFLLYQNGLANTCLLEASNITPWTYKNIASAGTKLKEYSWTSQFIEEYKERIQHDHADSFYAFAKANLELNQEHYKEAIRTLQQAEVKDLFILLDTSVIRIKSYYAMERFDLLEYALDNFKQLLKRREVLTYHKENYSNFIRFMRHLSHLDHGNKAANVKLEAEIKSASILTERAWLLSQMKML